MDALIHPIIISLYTAVAIGVFIFCCIEDLRKPQHWHYQPFWNAIIALCWLPFALLMLLFMPIQFLRWLYRRVTRKS